jgi:hypothetical protein
VRQHIYGIKAQNFLFSFVPKEHKSNVSKYEVEHTAAPCILYTTGQDVFKWLTYNVYHTANEWLKA